MFLGTFNIKKDKFYLYITKKYIISNSFKSVKPLKMVREVQQQNVPQKVHAETENVRLLTTEDLLPAQKL